MADLHELRTGRWDQIVLPDQVEHYPTMLTHGERRLLHWLARDVWEGWGAIVDAGCFLGGSTAALASGIAAREQAPAPGGPTPPMWTYDLFLADEFAIRSGHLSRWPDIRVDESFRAAFDDLIGDLGALTRVREGDITAEQWDGGPIEILFLDVLKNPQINDAVLSRFLPSLVAGRSVIVQQDYVHGMLPWIHITMELLDDAVERIADEAGSRVYAVTGEITAERIAEILPLDEQVSRERQHELMERVVSDTWGDARGMLLLAQANLLRAHGQLATAEAILAHVETRYRDAHSVSYDAAETRRVLERSGWSQRAEASVS